MNSREMFADCDLRTGVSPVPVGTRWALLRGDSLRVLATVWTNSVDSLVTDPPAGIGFMGADWDSDLGGRNQWISAMSLVARECLRVLKPGAFGVVWALPRTSHWTATAFENAGFDIRDIVHHLFGTGFPKGTDKSTIPDEWAGWNTALKPAAEHWILVRKPQVGTLAENLAAFGAGALNIDGARLGGDTRQERSRDVSQTGWNYKPQAVCGSELGRWPANVTLSPVAADELDEQAGQRGAASPVKGTEPSSAVDPAARVLSPRKRVAGAFHADSGGPSRFFYVAKPSTSEREAGCEDLPLQQQDESRDADAAGANNPRNRGGRERRNHHPTVKSIDLMRWLVRLVTPHSGVVLDPFAGSGTTGCAAVLEGMRFLGIERDEKFAAIAGARIAHWGGSLESEAKR